MAVKTTTKLKHTDDAIFAAKATAVVKDVRKVATPAVRIVYKRRELTGLM